MTVTVDSASTTTMEGDSDMTVTEWTTRDVKPTRQPAPAWRKGARALAKRFGTTDVWAAQDPEGSGVWMVTDAYALRLFGPDTVEAQALVAWRAEHGGGVDGRALAVRVWRGGKNDMAPADYRRDGLTWETMAKLVAGAEAHAVTVVDAIVETDDRRARDGGLVAALDRDGQELAVFAPAVLAGALGDGETLMVANEYKPAVVRDGDGVTVGIVMPVRGWGV